MSLENGGDVAYYLGTHMDEAKKIAAMPPLKQIIEVGKIAHKLSLEPSKPKPSKAPAPISPLSGAAAPDSSAPSDKDDMATWIKKRNTQVYGKSAR